jgi:hypothetical protein
MKHGKDIDLIRLNVVDDAVWPLDNLSKMLHFIFGNHPPGEGESSDLLGSMR